MQKRIITNPKNNNSLIQLIKDESINYNAFKKALRKKDVLINNVRINEMVSLKANDEVTIFLPEERQVKIDIVLEDNNFLVVNKPSGMETTIKDSVDNKSLEGCFPNARAVHRLDRNTEGLVILAKNKEYENVFVQAFKNGEIEKTYTAKVFGRCDFRQKIFYANLEKDSEKSLVKIYDKPTKNSVPIETEIKVIKCEDDFSLLEVKIKNGKTHQIRAHLAHLGFAIVGDLKYGNKVKNKPFKQMCLTASQIIFNTKQNKNLNYLNGKKIYVVPTWKF